MPDSISGHGAIFSFEATPGGGYVEIAEVGDVTDPGAMRNEFDVTTQALDIDNYILGVLRREALTMTLFWNITNTGHAALRAALIANNFVGFKLEYPDGDDWVGSGFVRQITRNNPVDGAQSADVTIRLSGPFFLQGVLVGTS